MSNKMPDNKGNKTSKVSTYKRRQNKRPTIEVTNLSENKQLSTLTNKRRRR